jgi:hypothetical protein
LQGTQPIATPLFGSISSYPKNNRKIGKDLQRSAISQKNRSLNPKRLNLNINLQA